MTDVNLKTFEELGKPFHPDNVQFRVGATTQDKERGLALAFIDARVIQDRLDEVLGPHNWTHYLEVLPNNTTSVSINIKVGDDWLSKAGVCSGDEDKGGAGGTATIAFKRAAVMWGIGRYLYGIKNLWVAIKPKGKSHVVAETPKLPPEMLPEGFEYPSTTKRKTKATKKTTKAVKEEKLPEEEEEQKETEKETPVETANDLERALAYVVPEDAPMAGDTLETVLNDKALSEMVIMYLAGESKSPAGKMFKATRTEDKKVQAAAKFVAKDKGWIK